jgi:hypothetical protein
MNRSSRREGALISRKQSEPRYLGCCYTWCDRTGIAIVARLIQSECVKNTKTTQMKRLWDCLTLSDFVKFS